jgi:hypothetical protein
MPQIGQVPGSSRTIWGCIGHTYWIGVAIVGGAVGSRAIPHFGQGPGLSASTSGCGDLRGIVRARTLSRATMANVKQNLLLAFVYNALGIPVAAGILYPAIGVLLSPMIASAAMSLSSVSVIANALRLRGARI